MMPMVTRAGAVLALIVGLAFPASAQTPRTWSGFVAGSPAATLPLGSGDSVPVVQSGVTKHVPGNGFAVQSANNTFSATNNFTGIFEIGGALQSFPGSGLLVGTGDTQTLINKTISGASNTLTNLPVSALTGSNGVTNAMLAQGAANTLKGNPTSSNANEQDVSVPPCADSAGNHINWIAGTGFSCGNTSSIGTPNYTLGSGFVNVLRNASFSLWPNGTSGVISSAPSGISYIAANGWAVKAQGAAGAWAKQMGGNNGTAQNLKLTGATSNTDISLAQRIESIDAARLAGLAVTFQCAVYNNSGASLTPTLATYYPASGDTWGSPSNDLSATNLQAIANASWGIESYTFTPSANAIRGYEILLDFGALNANTKSVYVTACDLRPTPGVGAGLNSAPPAPELPSIAYEINRGARYFQTTYGNNINPGNATAYGMVSFTTSPTGDDAGVTFPVEMWSTPSNIELFDSAGSANKTSSASAGVFSPGVNSSAAYALSSKGFNINIGGSSIPNFTHYAAYADFW
jgi:hypothetical protein